MNIGLALSGGGLRATVFHLGVLARLAEGGQLADVTALSTVSGGSLAMALLFAATDHQWPDAATYRTHVVPHARRLLTTHDLQSTFLRRILRAPLSLFRARASDVAHLLEAVWDVRGSLTDLPAKPNWTINATCYETGVGWRFTRERVGDYQFGYTFRPAVPISQAVAASAAFPGAIGPLVFDTTPWDWHQFQQDDTGAVRLVRQEPPHPAVRLWDGGVYENLGVEALFKPEGYAAGIDFLLTCDAGAVAGQAVYGFLKAPYRLISLATNQVRSLRARMVVNHLVNGGRGSYLQIDNDAAYLLTRAGRDPAEIEAIAGRCLPPEDARRAGTFTTTLRRLTSAEFDLLFRQGYEVADVTMYAFASGGQPAVLGFDPTRWAS